MEVKAIRELLKTSLNWRPTCVFLIREVNSIQFYGINGSRNKLRAVAIYNIISGELEIVE